MTTQLTWDVARAGGFVAWGLAAASVVWGLAISSRIARTRPWPAWLLDLHRFLGGIAVVFVVVHVAAILADSYTSIGLTNVLVPLTGTWHPLAVAWGIVAFYALLAVELTSLARSRLSLRVWRRVHFASFAVFVTSTIHALTAGTDARSAPFLDVMIGVCSVVLALLVVRITRYRPSARVARAATPYAISVPSRPDVPAS